MIETNFSSTHEQEKLHHRYVTQKICRDIAWDLRTWSRHLAFVPEVTVDCDL